MPSQKRAALLPELLAARNAGTPASPESAAKPVKKQPIALNGKALDGKPSTKKEPKAPRRDVRKSKRARRKAALNETTTANQSTHGIFFRKGAATSADFRPWYWRY